MYLKALEIQGFKSFPEKTTLTFEKEITAIVGPNGSGKSNISDALLWVMGEQRSKALRGGKMEDVIFGGTEKRSPMGFAQVSLILDNSAGLFEIDAPEVVITRRYYRNGESEYYLNREAVRLKDITGLLMDTGLGRDGYSVIGQGRIAEIVSARSTDRREIFEEAAGISRYRYRKEEAERKLERTEDNLLRINDKIDELELQVGPLQKQAETAKKYLVLRDEQRGLEISLWMQTLDRLQSERETLNADFTRAQADLSGAQAALESLYAAGENIGAKMRECDVELEGVREKQGVSEAAAAECDSAAAVLEAGLEHNRQNIARMKEEMDEQSGRTETLRAQASEQTVRAAEIDGILAAKAAESDGIRSEMEAQAREADDAQQGLAALVAEENAAADAVTKCVTTLSMLADRKTELAGRAESIDGEIAAAEEKYREITASLHAAGKEYETAKERVDEINNVLNGHKLLLGSREQAVKDLSAEVSRLTAEKRSAEDRTRLLAEMEKEYEGMGKAVKTVMLSASRGTLRGVHGPVANLVTVPDKYTVAIETALGAAMQNIVVDTQDAGKSAIELLKRSDAGRATFLPIDTIRPGSLQKIPAGEPGYLGIASELVKFDPKYAGIFGNLLGRTVVAETLGDAVQMSRRYENRLRIVTLDGQMINAGGSMTGGSAARNVGILSRANELKKLRERLAVLTEKEKTAAEKLAEAERVLSGAKYESEVASTQLGAASETLHKQETEVSQYRLMRSTLDESIESLEQEKAGLSANQKENERRMAELAGEQKRLEAELTALRERIAAATEGQADFARQRQERSERLAALRADCAALESERDAALRSAESFQTLIDALSGDRAQRERNVAELEQRCGEIEAEIAQQRDAAAAHRAEAEARKREVTGINALKLELEGKRTRSDREAQEKNREILDLQSVCARYEQKKQAAEMEEKQLVDKLWENYELSRTAAKQLAQPLESVSAAQKRVAELRREITRLGPVNVGAIEQFEQINERYTFLRTQRDDVESAKRDLLKIIGDVTGEMKEIFLREFAAIDAGFREVFLELFGGGKASLELEDPENPLECGIEIRVQPPGKAVTTISLLSGGEKSFVAICLYFAIMKVRPTPFCIMDEIDAALDEANVERYANYMRGLAKNTQFITITHHRATMEEADVLYGVTMQEKGVTTVLSIDLDEAERTAAN